MSAARLFLPSKEQDSKSVTIVLKPVEWGESVEEVVKHFHHDQGLQGGNKPKQQTWPNQTDLSV